MKRLFPLIALLGLIAAGCNINESPGNHGTNTPSKEPPSGNTGPGSGGTRSGGTGTGSPDK